VGEEGGVAFAVGKERMREQSLELAANRDGVHCWILLSEILDGFGAYGHANSFRIAYHTSLPWTCPYRIELE